MTVLATAIAVLSAEITQAHDGWVQLLPAGHFAAPDGRPNDVPNGQWYLDGAIAKRLIAQVAAKANDLVIDYEHQTLLAEQNGKEAPAAGWFKAMEWREGKGLFIKPNWTAKARDYIQNHEYRYLSAVFPYDKNTGEPLAIRMAALVNAPGLDGLEAVQAALKALNQRPLDQEPHKRSPNEDHSMDPILLAILAALGVEVPENGSPTEEQLKQAQSTLKDLQAKADTAKADKDEVAALKTQLASAQKSDVDLRQYVPRATYDGLVGELAVLKASSDSQDIKTLLDTRFSEGRFLKAERDYLEGFAKQQGVAALKAMLDARAPIASLKTQQTTTAPTAPTSTTLTAEEEAVLKATGMSRDAFLANREA